MSVVDSKKPPPRRKRHGKNKRRKQKNRHERPNKNIKIELFHLSLTGTNILGLSVTMTNCVIKNSKEKIAKKGNKKGIRDGEPGNLNKENAEKGTKKDS